MEASGGNSGRSSAAGDHTAGDHTAGDHTAEGHKASGGDSGRVASGGNSGRSPGAKGRGAGGRKASGRRSGLVRGLHPGTREVSPSGPLIILHHVMPKDNNWSHMWLLRPMRLTWLSQEASHNPKEYIIASLTIKVTSGITSGTTIGMTSRTTIGATNGTTIWIF